MRVSSIPTQCLSAVSVCSRSASLSMFVPNVSISYSSYLIPCATSARIKRKNLVLTHSIASITKIMAFRLRPPNTVLLYCYTMPRISTTPFYYVPNHSFKNVVMFVSPDDVVLKLNIPISWYIYFLKITHALFSSLYRSFIFQLTVASLLTNIFFIFPLLTFFQLTTPIPFLFYLALIPSTTLKTSILHASTKSPVHPCLTFLSMVSFSFEFTINYHYNNCL